MHPASLTSLLIIRLPILSPSYHFQHKIKNCYTIIQRRHVTMSLLETTDGKAANVGKEREASSKLFIEHQKRHLTGGTK